MWVRADAPGATLNLRLEEFTAANVRPGSAITSTVLTTGWQQVSTAIPITSPGSKLDLNAYVPKGSPGTSFYADEVAMYHR
jgi:hypothetical protein